MSRFLLAILLLIISFSFLAQNVFIIKYNTEQTVLAEEEAKSEKETENSKLDNVKDKIFHSYSNNEQGNYQATALPATFEYLNISKGFTDKPYTPPDLGWSLCLFIFLFLLSLFVQ